MVKGRKLAWTEERTEGSDNFSMVSSCCLVCFWPNWVCLHWQCVSHYVVMNMNRNVCESGPGSTLHDVICTWTPRRPFSLKSLFGCGLRCAVDSHIQRSYTTTHKKVWASRFDSNLSADFSQVEINNTDNCGWERWAKKWCSTCIKKHVTL